MKEGLSAQVRARRPGARYLGEGRCEFRIWSPLVERLEVEIVSPDRRIVRPHQQERGCWHAEAEGILPGARYFYRLEGEVVRPDPASHFQPEGVHGPSEVVDHSAFKWEDAEWSGVPLEEMIIYELHTGTFTPEGTFDAIIPRLGDLRELGVNALEIMPVAQFPGERNWGYDGAYPYAVQNSYGGPQGLKRLVNACHRAGIAVILDVVYNHLGPEGSYFGSYAPYFTEKYRTPWGNAINFDDEYSDNVRSYFIENARYWISDYHMDALRLDAIHAIYDFSPRHILQEIGEAVHEVANDQGRKCHVIAESDLNDTKIIRPASLGGYGLDAQWCDDFHHSLWSLITKETSGYYSDFGGIDHMAKAEKEGFVYSGQHSVYRRRRHGTSSEGIPGHHLIVFSQNHDQIGNRMYGERLSALASMEALKLAAGAVILSPYLPMLFMGEEYAEDVPFLYFVSHTDADLIAAVRQGRKDEFKSFDWEADPPDPQSEETFLRSKLAWEERAEGDHRVMLEFYRRLIRLRKDVPALSRLDKKEMDVSAAGEDLLLIRRRSKESHIFCVMNFGTVVRAFEVTMPEREWHKIFDSAEEAWKGPGSSLPPVIRQGERLTVTATSFGLFELKNEGSCA